MTFRDGEARFQLRHGESVAGVGIPAGRIYTVEESDNDGYIVTSSGAAGMIKSGETAEAEFNNHLSKPIPEEEPLKTGDEATPAIWLALMAASVIGLFAVVGLRKKQRG